MNYCKSLGQKHLLNDLYVNVILCEACQSIKWFSIQYNRCLFLALSKENIWAPHDEALVLLKDWNNLLNMVFLYEVIHKIIYRHQAAVLWYWHTCKDYISSTSAARCADQWEEWTAGRCLLQKQACTSLQGRRTRELNVQKARTQSSRSVSDSLLMCMNGKQTAVKLWTVCNGAESEMHEAVQLCVDWFQFKAAGGDGLCLKNLNHL